jgi:hypothetical protein
MVLRESLRILHNKCIMLASINKGYSKEFAVSGAKIGSICNVRLPNRYYGVRQVALAAQDTQESTVPVQLTTNYQVGLNFTQQDLTLSLDDFSKRIITPAMTTMATMIDYDGFALFKKVYHQAGTPGYTPGTTGGTVGSMTDSSAPNIYLNAGALLNSVACPQGPDRWIAYSPFAEARSVGALAGLFNPAPTISNQFMEASIKEALGFNFAMGQNVNSLLTGTRSATSAQVYGAGQIGSSLVTSGWGASNTLKEGEVIQVAGVYEVNPDSQKSIGLLQNFVVTADTTADASGNMTIPISPSIVVTGSLIANGTVNSSPAHGAAISLMSGSNATEYPQNIAYHKDFATFATADLLMPGGVDFAARDTLEDVSMLIVRQYDINTQNLPCRIDVLAGWSVLRPELAVRITG